MATYSIFFVLIIFALNSCCHQLKAKLLFDDVNNLKSNSDRDFEEIPCETETTEDWSIPLLRNGLGDDSYFIWSDKKIPFVIGDGFNETQNANILDAVADYNRIFKGCIEWVQKTDQVLEANHS